MTQSFACTACGAPNEPEAGSIRMSWMYCGANLTIPKHLQTKIMPDVDKAKPVVSLEVDAPDLLRKAQPIAIKAWNLYALWTWVRWILPTCLIALVVLIVLCTVLGALPFILCRF